MLGARCFIRDTGHGTAIDVGEWRAGDDSSATAGSIPYHHDQSTHICVPREMSAGPLGRRHETSGVAKQASSIDDPIAAHRFGKVLKEKGKVPSAATQIAPNIWCFTTRNTAQSDRLEIGTGPRTPHACFSCMAGQWLQMLVNYRLHFAVLADVSAYRAQSESLDAWITECNRGRDGCFVADWDALLARLPTPASAG